MFSVEMTLGAQNGGPSLTLIAEVHKSATVSVVPQSLLKEAGFTPSHHIPFQTADGRTIEREVIEVLTAIDGRSRISLIVFGDDDGPCAVGSLTLAALCLKIDEEKMELVRFLPRLPIDRPRPLFMRRQAE